VIGYENAAKVAKHAVSERVTIRQAVLDLGFVERGEIDEATLDRLLDVRTMTAPFPGQG
jgi:fumarate hydratase class II